MDATEWNDVTLKIASCSVSVVVVTYKLLQCQ